MRRRSLFIFRRPRIGAVGLTAPGEGRHDSYRKASRMPLVCRIPPEDSHRAEILRLLAGLEIPKDVSLTISRSPDPAVGWELTLASRDCVSVCCVPTNEGPPALMSVAATLLAAARMKA
jgi:hypothetical protein